LLLWAPWGPPFLDSQNRLHDLCRGQYEFCLPTRGIQVPASPEWLHEIKYDGYRLRLERNGDRVRLITRGGYDWTKRFPWIVEAALKNRQKHFVIDGEAVMLGVQAAALDDIASAIGRETVILPVLNGMDISRS
jgi:ATP-dependent DNA ligase